MLAGAGADEPDAMRLTQAFDGVVRDGHIEHPLELVGLGEDRALERGHRGCGVGHVPSRSWRRWPASSRARLELPQDRDHLAQQSPVGHLEGLEGGVLGDEHDAAATRIHRSYAMQAALCRVKGWDPFAALKATSSTQNVWPPTLS